MITDFQIRRRSMRGTRRFAALLGLNLLLLATPLSVTATTRAALADAVILIDVVISNEEVKGGGRTRVPLGSVVRLRVSADISDEVHVHGYNLRAPLSPDAPSVFEFTADIPGIFEVELEGPRRLLLELEVRP